MKKISTDLPKEVWIQMNRSPFTAECIADKKEWKKILDDIESGNYE